MAITTIDNLQEIQSAGANDVLPISTANGVKKIKASNLGGGGTEDYVAELAMDEEMNITSTTTLADLVAAYGQGKNLKAVIVGDASIHCYLCSYSDSEVIFFTIMNGSAANIVCGSSGWYLDH